ncbi:MAG: creatininase family protein [Candidatus Lokiarchaeota archaeon]|nr:creatininase family protein [Candidatus Lokiarchaeota archaeon]
MNEKVLYAELNPQEFRERLSKAPIAYLPLGTLEWHGRHMPLGADGLISQGFFIQLAHKVGGIVLPMFFLGPDDIEQHEGRPYYGMDILSYPKNIPQQLDGSAYWVSEEFFRQILKGTLVQLKRAGFKIVVAHGHGPSTMLFKKHIVNWKEEFKLELFTCWKQGEPPRIGLQTDHAAANETSLMMALRPELVNLENLPKILSDKPLGLLGRDPRKHASSETGRNILNMQINNMAKLLKEQLELTNLSNL